MAVKKVLMASMEYPGFAMAGGLAMAVQGLSSALVKKGIDVRVLIPNYFPERSNVKTVTIDGVEVATMPNDLFSGDSRSLLDSIYYRNPNPQEAQKTFSNVRAYAQAIPGAISGFATNEEWIPDVVHLHDWQNASVSQAMRERMDIPTVLTIHNARYIGKVPGSEPGMDMVQVIQVKDDYFRSLLELGLAFADAATTVSPSYAHEIATGQHSVDSRIRKRIETIGLEGVLNGINPQLMDPRNDAAIKAFNPNDMESVAYGKGANKLELHKCFGISADSSAFQVSMMSRLVEQKGIDLVIELLKETADLKGVQFLVVGKVDDETVKRQLESLGKNVKVYPQFVGPDLQHLVLAGSDAILMPSRYEPFGYTQLEGMRYGAVPIVTHVGGLKDTVVPFNGTDGYGFIITEARARNIRSALMDARQAFLNKDRWRLAMANGLDQDFSWDGPKNSVGKYIELYERVQQKRKA